MNARQLETHFEDVLPDIDVDTFNEMRDLMEDEMQELVDTFTANTPLLLNGIDDAISLGDTEAMVRPAHTLKSNSAALGMMRLSNYAFQLEQKGLQADTSGIAELLAQALAAWRTARAELPRLMESQVVSAFE